LGEILRSAAVWVRTQQSELVQDHITGLIHRKSVEIDLAFYDSPDFYDRLHRARNEASYRPVQLLESLSGILQNGITLAAMLAVIAPFGLWLPAALLAGTLPALYVVLRHTVRQHEWRLRVTADERRAWYFDWLLTAHDTAAELRLFSLGGKFRAAYDGLRARLRVEKSDLARDQAVGELTAGVLALLVGGASMLWMAWRAVRGLITLGDLALFYQAFQQGLGLMRSLLGNLGQLYSSSLFLGNLFEFLGLEPSVVSPASPRPATRSPPTATSTRWCAASPRASRITRPPSIRAAPAPSACTATAAARARRRSSSAPPTGARAGTTTASP
jgi:ATP-binding cassette subfamily B protein